MFGFEHILGLSTLTNSYKFYDVPYVELQYRINNQINNVYLRLQHPNLINKPTATLNISY